GTMSRDALMAPAIELAENGFIIGKGDADILAASAKHFAGEPNIAAIFLHDGKPWQAGERFIQKDLAHTLKLIAERGTDVFYRGEIADAIVAASSAHGGKLSKQDFADYTVTEGPPVKCIYRSYMLISAPPPSSGGAAICEILNI